MFRRRRIFHNYGPGRVMISLHAEVPATGDLIHLHDSVDNVERKLAGLLGCSAVIHMDPVVTDDERVNDLRARVTEIAHDVDSRLSIHDFRMVAGHTHTNLVFDVVVPYTVSMPDAEVRRRIAGAVHALDEKLFAVIEIDKSTVR